MSGPGMTIGVNLFRANVLNERSTDLTDEFIDGSVEMSIDRQVKLSAEITLKDGGLVTPFTDYLAPEIVIDYDDDRPTLTQQLGLYTFRVPTSLRRADDRTVSYECNDICQLAADDKLTPASTRSYGSGANVKTVVESLLSTTDTPIPAARITLPATTKTLAAAETFDVGVTRLEAANDILTRHGLYSLHTDLDGRVRSAGPYRKLARVQPYRTLTEADLVAPIEEQPSDANIANHIVVINEDATVAPIIGTAVNTDPDSPTSTVATGRRIVRVERVSGSVTQDDVNAVAENLLERSRSFYRVLKIKILPDPSALVPHQTVRLAFTSPALTPLNGRYWIRSAAMGLSPSKAAVTLEINQVTSDLTGGDI